MHTIKTRGSKVREHPSSTCSARCAHRKSRPLKWTHTCITCIRTCSGPRGNSWVQPDETHPSWNVIFMPRRIRRISPSTSWAFASISTWIAGDSLVDVWWLVLIVLMNYVEKLNQKYDIIYNIVLSDIYNFSMFDSNC